MRGEDGPEHFPLRIRPDRPKVEMLVGRVLGSFYTKPPELAGANWLNSMYMKTDRSNKLLYVASDVRGFSVVQLHEAHGDLAKTLNIVINYGNHAKLKI